MHEFLMALLGGVVAGFVLAILGFVYFWIGERLWGS